MVLLGKVSGLVDATDFSHLGVKVVEIDLKLQTVKVTAAPDLSYDTVYEKIHKTGKEIVSGKEVD